MKTATVSEFFLRDRLALAKSTHCLAQRRGWSVTFHAHDYAWREHFKATDFE